MTQISGTGVLKFERTKIKSFASGNNSSILVPTPQLSLVRFKHKPHGSTL